MDAKFSEYGKLSIIRNYSPDMESFGFSLSETFDCWLIHKKA